MYLQKEITNKNNFFVVLKVSAEIEGSESIPKCQGPATLGPSTEELKKKHTEEIWPTRDWSRAGGWGLQDFRSATFSSGLLPEDNVNDQYR